MINKFLQFIKKQQLAIRLARFDCLFITDSLSTFDSVRPLAKLFRRKSRLTPVLRVQTFLEYIQSPLLFAVYEEITSRTDIVPEAAYVLPVPSRLLSGDILYRTNAPLKDRSFYLGLFREIVRRDLPELENQYKIFEKRIDTLFDMRFYGSELEHICEDAAGADTYCRYEVDWLKTNREKLYLSFDEPCRQTSSLNKEAQKNLAALFGYLLFEKSVFVSYWDSLCVNKESQVSFLNFDAVYPAYPELKRYAADFILDGRRPEKSEEYKISRGLKLLRDFCPSVRLPEFWDKYLEAESFIPREYPVPNQEFLRRLKENGMSLGQHHPIIMSDPHELSYLLRNPKLKNDPQFRKSSFFYWGPMALIFVYLLYYF